jgi:hypothetical protein
MGHHLAREAQSWAPESLTWRERYALCVLALAAFDSTRNAPAASREIR